MSSVLENAAQATRLKGDETFQSVLQEVRESQIRTFLDAGGNSEAREKAHHIICAVTEIEAVIERRIASGSMEARKGQHRG